MQINLAIDAMGGDSGPRTNVAGTLLALTQDPLLTVTLVGDKSLLQTLLSQHHLSSVFASRIALLGSDEVIGMDESPASALRNRKHSSMHRTVQLVADGQCQAGVSGGNTGALMLIGRHYLGMLPGIERPAICTAIPTRKGRSYLMDLGANVECNAEHLLQFALMGSEMIRVVEGQASPRVGLLNVGHEAIKGNTLVKLAAHLIDEHPAVNYAGYVEGDEIFAGDLDLVVCDGFVGNIALKTSEGLARFLSGQIQGLFEKSIYSRLVGLMARPVLKQLKQQMDPVRYNGGSFLGLRGCLVKSHGNADAAGFSFAIMRAATEARQGLSAHLLRQLQQQELPSG
ncbi:phosphate acyltransferase PlsX [Marinospirillum alkaliphilum]|uniref:Phosphate acyltransferase n=1 Tax=Marinospirillum alkaliphilum DSM 21637 TaxID=1122209 RepID=A0A1K1X846_9GAMM|nr:phosphate acyltransferase PlsX [Marinospirillum alkaliphilum]SFX45332.1 phosphate:acyl-[acyl carrier protein] acyltransferase [Marinospirillum alkaliphilum DSM 21637]